MKYSHCLFVGGPHDSRQIKVDDDLINCKVLNATPNGPEEFWYRRETLRCGRVDFDLFILEPVSIEMAMRKILDRYAKANNEPNF